MSICGKNACKKCEYKDRCANSDARQQTNEEWLKSLDTEGLVDLLYDVHYGGASVVQKPWIAEHKERIKMQYRGWLKEIHE